MIRVLLAEDHILVREGTRKILEDDAEIEVVGETGSGKEALSLARRLRPDMLLLDIRLEGMSGVDVARALRIRLPEIKIVIVTAYDDPVFARNLFTIGVDGFLLKSTPGRELLAAVHAVYRGEQVLDDAIACHEDTAADAIADTAADAIAPASIRPLSARERQVLAILYEGATNAEIGRRLDLTERTAATYVGSAMAKLGAHSRTELVRKALDLGILTPE